MGGGDQISKAGLNDTDGSFFHVVGNSKGCEQQRGRRLALLH